MSIRIGNTAYIDGMAPIEVTPGMVTLFTIPFEPTKNTLDDLLSGRPGGIVRIANVREQATTVWKPPS